MVNKILYFCITILIMIFSSCSFDSVEEAGIKYPTKAAFTVPVNIQWEQVGFAKELINVKDNFKPRLPWQKNIDRHILINKTSFLRSPDAPSNCQGIACKTQIEYKGYSWTKLANPLAIDYIPSKTDMLKPAEGHLVVKVIKKCQIVIFEEEIYQMADGKGNLYVMHATETGTPDLNVVLPQGFTLRKVRLQEIKKIVISILLVITWGKDIININMQIHIIRVSETSSIFSKTGVSSLLYFIWSIHASGRFDNNTLNLTPISG